MSSSNLDSVQQTIKIIILKKQKKKKQAYNGTRFPGSTFSHQHQIVYTGYQFPGMAGVGMRVRNGK